MKIAMLGHKRIPSCEGGVEVVVEELAVRMASKGNKVTCYNRSGHHVAGQEYDEEQHSEYKGIRMKYVPTINRRGLAAMTSSIFASISAALGNYDVVHFHAEGPAFMCWLPKLFGKRIVVTVHGLDHQRAKWGKFASWYILSGERNAVRFADEIIVLSENVRQYFLDTYNRKTVFIPNGIRESIRHPAQLITEKFGLKADDYILYLGRMVPEKGIHYLLEAFKGIPTDKKLVIAGGSSDTQEYQKKIHDMAEGDTRILFTGFVQGRMKEELYSNAYIYCLPTDLEGMPLSLLEAMSYGNCCVTSDIPECTEVVEEHAVTFAKSNVAELRKKLKKLCEDSQLVEHYRSEASEYICRKYNWDTIVDDTLALYQRKKTK